MQAPLALWHESSQKSALLPTVLRPLASGTCEIQGVYSLISRGTERLVALGGVPQTLWNEMEVPYMEGGFGFPIKYGYSWVGKVISPSHPLAGQHVHLLHPHQNWIRAHTTDLFPIPENVPTRRAILASNLETALNAIWDAGVSIGDRVLVVGFGLIGSLITRLLSYIPKVEVVVCDISTYRSGLAEKMGFRVCEPTDLSPYFDCAFHTSASSSGLQTCISQVGFEGKVIELSWYGNQETSIALGQSFHSQRKQLISSQVSHLPADRKSRWDYKRRKEVVFDLLTRPEFDEHLTHTTRFQQLPMIFDRIRSGEDNALAWCVEYGN